MPAGPASGECFGAEVEMQLVSSLRVSFWLAMEW
jgi:hypothetical protein